jgi:ABC-type transport system involved in multi-copper enzyme maturation permease subunit
MIGLIGAEILKLRHRWATYIVPLTGIVLMGLIFLVFGVQAGRATDGFGGSDRSGVEGLLAFPFAFRIVDAFVFVLGSFLAIAYAAAVAGSDWTWGIMRVVIARGEGRVRYVLAKAIGFAIVLIAGVLVAYVFGILFTYMAGALGGFSVGNPIANGNAGELFQSIWRGSVVLLERCSLGFAVAMVLRSQLAGVVVGIALAIVEPILTTVLSAMNRSGSLFGNGSRGHEWFQYLPFNVGNSVFYGGGSLSDPGTLLQAPLPFSEALAATLIYTAIFIGVACLRTRRAEISG